MNGSRATSKRRDGPFQLGDGYASDEDEGKRLSRHVRGFADHIASVPRKAESVYEKAKSVTVKGREAVEVDSFVNDLRNQVAHLSKANSSLKNKVVFFKTLHETETRKRGPYDHIPPRITNQPKRAQPTMGIHTRNPSRGVESRITITNDHHNHEEVQKLEELISMLRQKVSHAEQELELCKQQLTQTLAEHAEIQQNNDVDRLCLQHQLNESASKVQEAERCCQIYEDKVSILHKAHAEALDAAEKLAQELKESRRINASLEASLQSAKIAQKTEKEYLVMIEDLRNEKALLEREMMTLLEKQFQPTPVPLIQDNSNFYEVTSLKAKIQHIEAQLQTVSTEKNQLYKTIKDLNDKIKSLLEEKREVDTNLYNARAALDELQQKWDDITEKGKWSVDDIQEAMLFFLKHKNDKFVLPDMPDAQEYQKQLQEMRLRLAECLQEIEKTKTLLRLQETINLEYKQQVKSLEEAQHALKNEYELRLEENARLLDLRGNKIAYLEEMLKGVAYGAYLTPKEGEYTGTASTSAHRLKSGENLLQIHIGSAIFAEDGQLLILRNSLEDLDTITTFFYFDFFEFETSISTLGLGQKPVYNYTAEFITFADDFFLHYMDSKKLTLHLCRSNGIQFQEIGTCSISLRDIIEMESTRQIKYYSDIYSSTDNKAIIGKVEYSFCIAQPMDQVVRAFKERTFALGLLSISDYASLKIPSHKPSGNELEITVLACTELPSSISKKSRPYVWISMDFVDDFFTPSVVDGDLKNPSFNFSKLVSLPISHDFDRYLRTGSLSVRVMDDIIGEESFLFGSASVSLSNLTNSELGIEVTCPLLDLNGKACGGAISLTLKWASQYKAPIAPIISIMDRPSVKQEMSQESAGSSHAHSDKQEAPKRVDTATSTEALIKHRKLRRKSKELGKKPTSAQDLSSSVKHNNGGKFIGDAFKDGTGFGSVDSDWNWKTGTPEAKRSKEPSRRPSSVYSSGRRVSISADAVPKLKPMTNDSKRSSSPLSKGPIDIASGPPKKPAPFPKKQFLKGDYSKKSLLTSQDIADKSNFEIPTVLKISLQSVSSSISGTSQRFLEGDKSLIASQDLSKSKSNASGKLQASPLAKMPPTVAQNENAASDKSSSVELSYENDFSADDKQSEDNSSGIEEDIAEVSSEEENERTTSSMPFGDTSKSIEPIKSVSKVESNELPNLPSKYSSKIPQITVSAGELQKSIAVPVTKAPANVFRIGVTNLNFDNDTRLSFAKELESFFVAIDLFGRESSSLTLPKSSGILNVDFVNDLNINFIKASGLSVSSALRIGLVFEPPNDGECTDFGFAELKIATLVSSDLDEKSVELAIKSEEDAEIQLGTMNLALEGLQVLRDCVKPAESAVLAATQSLIPTSSSQPNTLDLSTSFPGISLNLKQLQIDVQGSQKAGIEHEWSSFFIGMDFMDVPQDELESITYNIDSQSKSSVLELGFSKEFSLISDQMKSLFVTSLKSTEQSLKISFLYEPQDENAECFEFAKCAVDLEYLLNNSVENSPSETRVIKSLILDVKSDDRSNIVVGRLTLDIGDIAYLRSLLGIKMASKIPNAIRQTDSFVSEGEIITTASAVDPLRSLVESTSIRFILEKVVITPEFKGFVDVSSVYVCYDFLGYPAELLESNSLEWTGVDLSVNFSADILLKGTPYQKELSRLFATQTRPTIAFNLVSELTGQEDEDEEQIQCEDIALATLDLADTILKSPALLKGNALSKGAEELLVEHLAIPLISVQEGALPPGTLVGSLLVSFSRKV